MSPTRFSRESHEDGFTLAELLVVIAIMGLIFAIALPIYGNYVKDTRIKTIKGDVTATMNNVERYLDLNPGASAVDLSNSSNVRRVLTDTSGAEGMAVAGDYSGYTITGTNVSLLGNSSSYTYNSSTGTYTATGQFQKR